MGQELGQDQMALKRSPSWNWQHQLVRVARADGQEKELGQDQMALKMSPSWQLQRQLGNMLLEAFNRCMVKTWPNWQICESIFV